MSRHGSMKAGATTLVDVCAGVQPNEQVLIVTDERKQPIAEAIHDMVLERGAEPTIALINDRMQDSSEPPAPIAAAMKAADVIFTPLSISITHTRALQDACEAGSRAVVMSGFSQSMMEGGGIEADFRELKPVCERVAGYLHRGKKARITTPAGTDVTIDIEGREGIAKTCIVERGEFSPVPDIEATISPLEGSANGVIVTDASIPYLGIGVLNDETVTCRVKDGFITSVEGGQAAETLRSSWESMNEPLVYNVAELGIGLNPNCTLTGEMLEDEGCWGTVHFGIGTSITLGGNVETVCHYDLLMHNTTIEIDGEPILKDGELLV